ncbi:hypothetical protein LSAT2_011817 [Lamellibrachia satsuma]|nr:hypothetical protein LSAT2_011817 [Lamellibrachia satsuma]
MFGDKKVTGILAIMMFGDKKVTGILAIMMFGDKKVTGILSVMMFGDKKVTGILAIMMFGDKKVTGILTIMMFGDKKVTGILAIMMFGDKKVTGILAVMMFGDKKVTGQGGSKLVLQAVKDLELLTTIIPKDKEAHCQSNGPHHTNSQREAIPPSPDKGHPTNPLSKGELEKKRGTLRRPAHTISHLDSTATLDDHHRSVSLLFFSPLSDIT